MPREDRTDFLRLRAPVIRLRRRFAWQNLSNACVNWTIFALFLAILWRLARTWFPKQTASVLPFGLGLFAFACVISLAIVLQRAWKHPTDRALSLLIDRGLNEGDHLTNALHFAEIPQEMRSILEQAVVEQGLQSLPLIQRKFILPRRRTRRWPLVVLLGTSVVGSIFFAYTPRKRSLTVAPAPPATVDWSFSEDELDAHEKRFSAQKAQFNRPPLAPATKAFEGLLQDLRHRRLDRDQALRRVAELIAQVTAVPAEGTVAPNVALLSVGAPLAQSPITRELFSTLGTGKVKDVKAALDALAARFAEPRTAPTQEELAHLRRAIELEKRTLEKRLAQEHAEAAALTLEKQSLLARRDRTEASSVDPLREQKLSRRLETLNRNRSSLERSHRILSALDRDLAQAAESLRKKLEMSSSRFSSTNETLDETLAAELTVEQKRRLLEELRALEESLAKSERSPSLKQATLERFIERAQGTQPNVSKREGSRKIGVNDASIATPNPTGSSLIVGIGLTDSEKEGSLNQPSQERSGGQGRSLGINHDPQIRGSEETVRQVPKNDVAAITAKTKDETVSAEVVATSAERGFLTTGYASVYRAYEPVRESLLERPNVPQGKRSQVRRYFQLIRPRETKE
jgi:hypothetical protein